MVKLEATRNSKFRSVRSPGSSPGSGTKYASVVQLERINDDTRITFWLSNVPFILGAFTSIRTFIGLGVNKIDHTNPFTHYMCLITGTTIYTISNWWYDIIMYNDTDELGFTIFITVLICVPWGLIEFLSWKKGKREITK